MSSDHGQDNRSLTRADSTYSVNSTVSQESREHKIPRSSKFSLNQRRNFASIIMKLWLTEPFLRFGANTH